MPFLPRVERDRSGFSLHGKTWMLAVLLNRSDGRWQHRWVLLPWFGIHDRRARFERKAPGPDRTMRTQRRLTAWMPWMMAIYAANERDEIAVAMQGRNDALH